jgi:hypothetical protein
MELKREDRIEERFEKIERRISDLTVSAKSKQELISKEKAKS